MIYRISQDFDSTTETSGDAAALAANLVSYLADFAEDLASCGEQVPTAYQLERQLRKMRAGDKLQLLDLTITAETAAGFCWFFHEPQYGAYHVIERHADGPARSYRVRFGIQLSTAGELSSDTYTGDLPNLAAARKVLEHLAPEAVQLPGKPAFLR